MERGKRASMREGPLAALFRKTEEEGLGENPGAGSSGEARSEQTADSGPPKGRCEFGPVPEQRGASGRPKGRSVFGKVPGPQERRVGKPHPSGDSQRSFDDRDPR